MVAVSSFADVREAQEIPSLQASIDRLALVKYAGASGDFAFQHWDHPKMTGQGFEDVIVHGWLTFAYMCQAVTRWAPREIADIHDFAVRYRRPTYPGAIECGGVVRRKREEGRARFVDLDLWAKGRAGDITTTASMTLLLV